VRALARRLSRLEARFIPQETEETARLREALRFWDMQEKAYRAKYGHPEPEPLWPPADHGPPWGVVEILNGPTR
jgi:hypothetical protein